MDKKISIIIPTLNEEKYLPKILETIKKQTFKDYEIIVADADSKDKTTEIALKYGARVVKGGMPAVGRNAGAKVARGEFLFFLDADTKLPLNFLENAYNEIQEKFIDLATCKINSISNLLFDKVIQDVTNTYIKSIRSFNPCAVGVCILVSKRLFERTKGFDETIKIGEDYEFVGRAAKIKPLHFLKSTKVFVSVRRYKKEGRINLIKKYIYTEARRIFSGEIRDNSIEYEFGKFGNFKNNKKDPLEKNLIKIDRKISAFNQKVKKLVK